MFAVTILGNNSALPAHNRFPTAQVVTFQDQLFLVDCGEGTQMQMSKYKIKRSRIHHIFISHLHGDHYFGLIGLLNSFSLLGRKDPLSIYAPPELKIIIDLQLQYAATTLGFPLDFISLTEDQTGIILEGKDIQVSYFKTHHRIPCFGFLFREKKEKRKLNIEEVRAHGIPTYFYSRLQEGEDYISREGVIVKNEWVTLDPLPGKSYAFCADTLYDESIIPYIEGCDMIYHESTYLQDQLERATQRFHTITVQAAAIARKAKVKKLLIGHFSSKYEELEPFLEECRPIFPNTDLAIEGVTFPVGATGQSS